MITEPLQQTESKDAPSSAVSQAAPPALRIDAISLRVTTSTRRGKPRKVLLNDLSTTIRPGELVVIVGGSGAGKSTLLNTLAGVKAPSSGRVLYNGADLYQNLASFRSELGYVPQDDIVHSELTVERTLHYAARLRLSPDLTPEQREAAVRHVTEALGLTAHADQRVSTLSGGQRKRTSIGVELLTRPGVFFLDEPTSGLDPATGRGMMRLLRRLADDGSTVVLTTHAPQDIALCDRVIVLAPGGVLAFAGPPREALEYFEAGSFEEIYERVTACADPVRPPVPGCGADGVWAESSHSELPVADAVRSAGMPAPPHRHGAGALRQWAVLTQRTAETLLRNRLTLAILAGSPMLVIAMFAVLFRRGAFDPAQPNAGAALMTLYWVAFAAFFFGLTYGLLMICTEIAIFRRERLVNLRVAPYVAAKVTVLLPVLAVVIGLMLAVLRLLDRLPDGGPELYTLLAVTLLLEGIAAIALGLLASAAVSHPEQATLALPMICFPQVLFSGAILPVPVMAGAGRAISWFVTDRWAFEALGRSAGVDDRFANGTSPLLAQYGQTFAGSETQAWLMLAVSAVVFLGLTGLVLARKSTAR